MHLIFYLGNNEELSLLELSVMGVKNLKISRKNIAEGNLEKAVDINFFQDQLGGIIKISQVIDITNNLEKVGESILTEIVGSKPKSKIVFGINFEGKSKNRTDIIVNEVKKRLKKFDLSSRYLNKRGKNIHNKAAFEALKKGGFIFDIIERKDQPGSYYIARSKTIQDVDTYSYRDYEKPFRDAKVGMLPPKLAQILLNIATGYINPELREKTAIYDPFCGSGTILAEALLNGYQIIGSDLESRMVEGCKKNIKYIEDIFGTQKNLNLKIFTHDATKAFSELKEVEHIVSETHLGPAFTSIPTDAILTKSKKELESLYLSFFRNASKILKKDGNIVVTMPHIIKRPFYSFSYLTEKICRENNLKLVNLGKKQASIIYSRPDQIIAREIFKFVKN